MVTSGPITVIGKDGLRGTVEAGSRARIGHDGQVALLLEGGQRALVPADLLEERADGSYYLPMSLADFAFDDGRAAGQETDHLVVPLLEERLHVGKRPVVRGRTRVHKYVTERAGYIDEPLLREEVDIRRVPINRPVETPPPVRQEGDTLIVPLIEEVLVIERRLVLREELHVTKRRSEVREQQHVTLRSEDVTVDRLDGAAKKEEDQR